MHDRKSWESFSPVATKSESFLPSSQHFGHERERKEKLILNTPLQIGG